MGTCITITKALTFLSSESQKLRRKRAGLKKVLEKIIAKNFPNFARDPNPQIQEVNPKQNKPKFIGSVFIMTALRSLSDYSNISVILVLASTDCFVYSGGGLGSQYDKRFSVKAWTF